MKRFYKAVSSRKSTAGNGYEICLDTKPIKADHGGPLRVPTQKLAALMVKEWAGQGENVVPASMPVTQLVKTACDVVGAQRSQMTETVCSYLDTDLLCYRAVNPPEIAEKQTEKWGPWLEWFEENFGAKLYTTQSVAALTQDEKAHQAVIKKVDALDDLRFSVLQFVTATSGSLVLALAFVANAITPHELYEAMFAEELYKAEIYNEAEHGFAPHVERQHQTVQAELSAAASLLAALG